MKRLSFLLLLLALTLCACRAQESPAPLPDAPAASPSDHASIPLTPDPTPDAPAEPTVDTPEDGVHNQATTTIDFSNGKITINGNEAGTLKEKMSKYYSEEKYPNFWRGDTLSDDTYHTLKLFFLERGGYDSNLAMKFNLAHVPETEGIKVDQFGNRLSGVVSSSL